MVEANHLLEQGIAAAKQGHLEEARRLLLRVASLQPQCLEAWLWLGALASDPMSAAEYLGRALELDPNSLRAQKGMEWARARLLEMATLPPSPPPLPVEDTLAAVDELSPLEPALEVQPILPSTEEAIPPAQPLPVMTEEELPLLPTSELPPQTSLFEESRPTPSPAPQEAFTPTQEPPQAPIQPVAAAQEPPQLPELPLIVDEPPAIPTPTPEVTAAEEPIREVLAEAAAEEAAPPGTTDYPRAVEIVIEIAEPRRRPFWQRLWRGRP